MILNSIPSRISLRCLWRKASHCDFSKMSYSENFYTIIRTAILAFSLISSDSWCSFLLQILSMITCMTFWTKFCACSLGIYYLERLRSDSTPSTWTGSSLSMSILEASGNMLIVMMSMISSFGMNTSALKSFLNNFSRFWNSFSFR